MIQRDIYQGSFRKMGKGRQNNTYEKHGGGGGANGVCAF